MSPLTQTGIYVWTSLSRGEAFEARRRQISDIKSCRTLLDVTYADPQAGVHLRAGNADKKMDQPLPILKRESETATFTLNIHVLFDERSHKLVASIAVERFEHLGRGGRSLIDQLATRVIEGRNGSSMAKKGVRKERLLRLSQ